MSLSQIVEVAVGLVLVYYVLGLIVSLLSSRFLETLETRGKALEGYLKEIVGETKLGELLEQPQIKSLAPIRYAGWTGVITGKLKEAKVERVPVANLVDAVFDLYGLVNRPYTAEELKSALAALPDSEAKTNFLKLAGQAVTNVDQLRAKAAMWFTGLMDQTAAKYKAHARQFVIGFSLLVTLVFGVDSIEFATQLWQNAELRTIANTKAELYLQQQGATANLDPLIKDLDALALRLGWWAAPAYLPLSTAPAGDWIGWVVKKIAGLIITAVAVSQGSSFWYDILCRLKGGNAPPPPADADST